VREKFSRRCVLQLKPLPSSNSYSVPGKIFILGEYAVLAGLPALVAAVGPRFQARAVSSVGAVTEWPSGAPVSRYLKRVYDEEGVKIQFEFFDPFEGAGGFGASTAQFALAYQLISSRKSSETNSWREVWKCYRELMSSDPLLPSGADLVAQWEGGAVFFDPTQMTCENLGKSFDWSQFLIFSATHQNGRKVPTHDHLRQLSLEKFPNSRPRLVSELKDLLGRGVHAIREGDSATLGRVMFDYASELCREGWEVKATTEDRLAFAECPGVLGVKGTGALQSDALIVLTQKGVDRTDLLQLAKKRDLQLVREGLSFEVGVKCENNE